MPRRVTFPSDGFDLVGYLHLPVNIAPGERRSAVVCCHGFGASQDRVLPDVAADLARRGYVALTIDYRGFGESPGPRWRMIPQEQVRDIQHALDYLQTLDMVDANHLGLWGTSFGGANVTYVAGVDTRVACTVSLVGVGHGERWLRSLRRAWEWRDFMREVEDDARQQAITGRSRMVPRTHMMLPDPASDLAIAATLAQYPAMCTEVPLETVRAVLDFRPDAVVHQIAPRPILFIVGDNDGLCLNDLTRDLFDRAGDPKRWVSLPGCGHYDAYTPAYLPTVLDESAAWLDRHLGV